MDHVRDPLVDPLGHAIEIALERREVSRRGSDEVRHWVPLLLSIATTLLALGVVYGSLGGRLGLIEYRLGQIEHRLDNGR